MKIEESSWQIEPESALTPSTKDQLLQAFQTSKDYRHGFIEESIRSRITSQIRTIRTQREWDYKEFAEAMGKKPSWVYRLEDPNSALPTLPTLLQVAEALDVGLDVRFRSFSELLNDVVTLNQESFRVPSFEEELKTGSFPPRTARRKPQAPRRHKYRRKDTADVNRKPHAFYHKSSPIEKIRLQHLACA